jgi:phosphoribosylformylglycinamidine synthase
MRRIRVPVRHGEGKFVTDERTLLDKWAESGQLVVRYVDPSRGYPGAGDEILPYPVSPNQSWRNIAGVCDPTGLVFGLMPHPEANHSTWLGAAWTREDTEHGEGEGLVIFRNAVNHVLG